MSFQALLTVSLVLFSVIDIIGSLPVIIDMKRQGIDIHPGGSTLTAGLLMLAFLFFGASMLSIFGIEVQSFALAGSLIIFFIGLEMTLGIRFFRSDPQTGSSGTIVPIAFPIIAGAGTLTTILSLRARYEMPIILVAILLNLVVVFVVLRASGHLALRMRPQVLEAMRKFFGILLIAIAFQMFRNNWLC
ncbi:MAG: MarC family protein [Bacteroidia bacterium]